MAPTTFSSYVLTDSASPHLELILRRLAQFSDEVLVVDSGNDDEVARIAQRSGCAYHFRRFDDFVLQREFATGLCRGEYVFFCDSDEIPSPELVAALGRLKATGPGDDLYCVRRNWHAFGRPVRGIYPVTSPDYPTRLARRSSAVFEAGRRVHERYVNYERSTKIEEPLLHYTFSSNAELLTKLKRYSFLEAKSVRKRSNAAWYLGKRLFSPIGAFFQWYLRRKGVCDGSTGLKLSLYAAACKYHKYRFAAMLAAAEDPSTRAAATTGDAP